MKFQKGDKAIVCCSVNEDTFLPHNLEIGREVEIEDTHIKWNKREAYRLKDITEILLAEELKHIK